MVVVWECCLNLAICRADDFIMKSIKNHDAYSPRLSRIGSFFAAKAGGKGWEMDEWVKLKATQNMRLWSCARRSQTDVRAEKEIRRPYSSPVHSLLGEEHRPDSSEHQQKPVAAEFKSSEVNNALITARLLCYS